LDLAAFEVPAPSATAAALAAAAARKISRMRSARGRSSTGPASDGNADVDGPDEAPRVAESLVSVSVSPETRAEDGSRPRSHRKAPTTAATAAHPPIHAYRPVELAIAPTVAREKTEDLRGLYKSLRAVPLALLSNLENLSLGQPGCAPFSSMTTAISQNS
jgi:hypothetical protein